MWLSEQELPFREPVPFGPQAGDCGCRGQLTPRWPGGWQIRLLAQNHVLGRPSPAGAEQQPKVIVR